MRYCVHTVMSPKYGAGEIGVFMPCLDLEKAKQAAKVLKARAGINHQIILALDQERKGFIAVVNELFQHSNYRYIVYTAEDAFPGMNWLKHAYDELERSQKGLLAFNDGKWFGQLAAFGMVRSSWARSVYTTGDLFYSGYQSHYADNELTLIAQAQQQLAYNPHAMLIEVDYQKERTWQSNPKDKALFQDRKTQRQPLPTT